MEAIARDQKSGQTGEGRTNRSPGPSVSIRQATRAKLSIADLTRDLPVVAVLAARDFKVKFKQSLLGPAWLFVQPLALLGAFAIGFGAVADVDTAGVPYALFALAGLSAWTFFQVALNMGSLSLVGNYALITRTACPRAALPVASVVANLPALAIPGTTALVLSLALGESSWRIALIPVALVWLLVLTAGACLLFAALAGRYRDVPAAMPFLLQLGLFISPIGYPIAGFSSLEQALMGLNPFAGVVELWRWCFLSDGSLATVTVLASLASSALVVLIGWHVFKRIEVTLADFI